MDPWTKLGIGMDMISVMVNFIKNQEPFTETILIRVSSLTLIERQNILLSNNNSSCNAWWELDSILVASSWVRQHSSGKFPEIKLSDFLRVLIG